MIGDVVDADGGCDVAFLKASIKSEFEKKLQAEAGWEEVTDCDRLDSVFYTLHEHGICALGKTGYEMSDGYSAVAEAVAIAPQGHYHGYCFYHGQDVEHAIAGRGIMIAFGDLSMILSLVCEWVMRLLTCCDVPGSQWFGMAL